VTLRAGTTNQPMDLSREIFSETPAELMQTVLRLLKLRGNAPPRPINVVVSDRDQRQIGKTFHRQQVANLPGEIARPKNSSEKILPLTFMIDERADASAFNCNKWSELLESFRNALNPRWRRVSVEKPVIAAATAGAPKRAQDR
jgi:hypothetical protein